MTPRQPDKKKYENLDIPFYPKCDNCGKQIYGFHKYIRKNGKLQMVHTYYNEEKEICEEVKVIEAPNDS